VLLASGATLCKYVGARGLEGLPRRFQTLRPEPWCALALALPARALRTALRSFQATPSELVPLDASLVGDPSKGDSKGDPLVHRGQDPLRTGAVNGRGALAMGLVGLGLAACAAGGLGLWTVATQHAPASAALWLGPCLAAFASFGCLAPLPDRLPCFVTPWRSLTSAESGCATADFASLCLASVLYRVGEGAVLTAILPLMLQVSVLMLQVRHGVRSKDRAL
jgi:hypothetical protein